MNDTWYNLTIPRHLNEKQKAYFWNHAQDHRPCGKNHRAGGPFDRSSPLSTSPTLRRANCIGTILDPLTIEPPPFSGTSNCHTEREACSCSSQGYSEVKNVYEIYERQDQLDPYSVDDLLTADDIITWVLVEESSVFHIRPAGVVDSEGHVLHFERFRSMSLIWSRSCWIGQKLN